ncbi:hypothetical protein QCA50_011376 [Cerrena zonata]|uniref:HMG box domain-containing protein n=1 Tax=Cerrena zonata TaxID=2478898 RepID=A0AAW0FXB3_9APHY
MAAPYDHDALLPDIDDDDGMPPLVDNPNPPMTFTFATDMTPITYGAAPAGFETNLPDPPRSMFIYSPPTSPILGPMKTSHAKKRDPSYIPRPPNAFILFRSHFIRAQHIPGKTEGNHSALSKIIGKYWKTLPREEREVWEAKAIVAQAEHRKRYPDWRFRPSANALAKVKDGPRKRNRKGRGEPEKGERSREKRCDKIADLLVAGTTGNALQAAIEAYDCEAGTKRVKEEGGGVVVMQVQEQISPLNVDVPRPQLHPIKASMPTSDQNNHRSLTPEAYHEGRFKTPLTSMFKRSSSAPASHNRNEVSSAQTETPPCVVNVPSPPVDITLSPAPCQTPNTEFSTQARVVGDITTFTAASTREKIKDVNRLVSIPSSVPGTTTRVADSTYIGGGEASPSGSQVYDPASVDITSNASCYSPIPTTPVFEQDLDEVSTPAQSPPAFEFIFGEIDNSPYSLSSPLLVGELGSNFTHAQSSYSSLKGWAGDSVSKRACANSWMTTLPLSPEPLIYDADRIMKDAFAAATVPYEEWSSGIGSPTDQLSFQFPDRSRGDLESLQYYAQGWQEIAAGHYDNRCQLF